MADHLARIYVCLAADEWGNEVMQEVAAELLAQWQKERNLIVVVYEHAGWYLAFARPPKDAKDKRPICVDTANDAAVLSRDAQFFWGQVRGLPEVCLAYTHRKSLVEREQEQLHTTTAQKETATCYMPQT